MLGPSTRGFRPSESAWTGKSFGPGSEVWATILGPANYLIPVTNFLLGWLIFDEALPPSRVIGFTLVWFALIFATVDMVRGSDKRGIPDQQVRTADV